MLSGEELEAFSILQKSGTLILEEAAVDEVLKTCKTSDFQTPTLNDKKLEKLKNESQTPQKLKNLKIKQYNKYQLKATVTSYKSLSINAKEEEANKKLKQSQGILSASSTKISNELQALSDGVAKLMTFFRHSNLGQGTNPLMFLISVFLGKISKPRRAKHNSINLIYQKAVLSEYPQSLLKFK